MLKKEVGARIHSRRKALGFTLQDVADRVHVACSTIQRYEAGTINKMKMPVLQAIANALSVSPDWLIGISDVMEASPSPEAPSIDEDAELREYLQQIKDDPSTRMMFDLARGATLEEIKATVAFLKALREQNTE